MLAAIDMNSNRLVNLPAPISADEPIRLADASILNGNGTLVINPLPTGGTTGQVLIKNSNTNFDTLWSSSLTSLTAVTVAGNVNATNVTAVNLNATSAVFSPNLIGGSGAASSVAVRSTSGTGSSDAIFFQTGPSGSIRWQIDTNGFLAGGVNITTSNSMPLTINTTAQSSKGLQLNGTDNHFIIMSPSLGGGTLNGVVQSGDNGILYTGASGPGSGAFVLAPWNNLPCGLRMDSNGNIINIGGIVSSDPVDGVGYTTGSGATVTQLTSKSTPVTINAINGTIVMNAASLATATTVAFSVTNSSVGANDNCILAIASGATAGAYQLLVMLAQLVS